MNNGKGSRRRPEDAKKIAENWERTFSKEAKATRRHACHSNLCDCGGLGSCMDPSCKEEP